MDKVSAIKFLHAILKLNETSVELQKLARISGSVTIFDNIVEELTDVFLTSFGFKPSTGVYNGCFDMVASMNSNDDIEAVYGIVLASAPK